MDKRHVDWSKCREVVCRSCGAVFDLWYGDEPRRAWRLWGLRYGEACPACGFSNTDGWCMPHDWRPVSPEFMVGGAGTMTVLVFVFLSWWGLALVAIGIVILALRAVVSKRQLDAARRAGKASDNTA